MFDTDVNINNKALRLQRTAISKSNLLLYRSHNTIFPKVHVKTWLRKNNSQIPLHFKGFSASDRDFFMRWKNKVLIALFFHFVQPERKWTAKFFSCLKFLLTWMLQENLLSLIMLFEIKASAFIFYNNILRLNRLWFCNINANKNFIF